MNNCAPTVQTVLFIEEHIMRIQSLPDSEELSQLGVQYVAKLAAGTVLSLYPSVHGRLWYCWNIAL